MTLHGYQAEGHRIIAFGLDDDALPTDNFKVLVDDWGARPGRQPLGAPVDIKVDTRGRLWVTEDRNGTLLVIQPEPPGARADSPRP